MTNHLILFSSDLHGNLVQYGKLVQFALEKRVDTVIVGGDIAPKGKPLGEFIGDQRDFLERRLPRLFSPFKDALPASRVLIMMGNDDCAVNRDLLQRFPGIYEDIHGKRLPLNPDFDVVGYSFVPITPFGIKDWEKYDFVHPPFELIDQYDHRRRVNYRYHGIKSHPNGWAPFQFKSAPEENDSIEMDLKGEVYQTAPRKTILVAHSPPDRTNLDLILNKNHVGSMALRMFIEGTQPYLTLHGHIHETVDVSGRFQDRLGDTLCMSSGNHNIGPALAVILLDLYAPEKAKRIIL